MRLVLLHGFTGGPDTFDGVRRLLSGFSFLSPQLGGHGLPPAPLGETFDQEVDRLAARIDDAGFRGALLCGYSLGARLALRLLLRHPALCRRAVLVGVNPGLTGDEAQQRANDDDVLADRLERGGLEAFMEAWQAQPLFATQSALPASVRAAESRRRRQHDARSLAAALRRLSLGRMPDSRPQLPSLDVPVTFVAGAQDAKFAALAAACAAAVPNGRAVVVPDSGHNVVLERPDAVASLLERESA